MKTSPFNKWAGIGARLKQSFLTRISCLVLLVLVAALAAEIVTAFRHQNYAMAHDESEHLHVVFALDRGERPYFDFIENHPVTPHLALLSASRELGLATPTSVYSLARSLVFVHFLGSVALLWLMLRLWSPRNTPRIKSLALLIWAVLFSGVWQQSTEWTWGHRGLWQVRPDWACFFYALLSVYLHLRFHFRVNAGKTTPFDWLLLATGAISGGLATGILAKSALLFAPYALTFVILAVLWPRFSIDFWSRHHRALLTGNVMFILLGVMTFAAIVAREVSLTDTTLNAYWTANFTLNSFKHLAISSHDFNPANVLRSLSGLSLSASVVVAIWLLARFSNAIRSDDRTTAGGLIFIVGTIAANAVLPAYSNGLTWPQYFIPSVLAMWSLGYLLLEDLTLVISDWLKPAGTLERLTPSGPTVRRITVGGLAGAVVLMIGLRVAATTDRVIGINEVLRDTSIRLAQPLPAFIPEARLPRDLTYLIFEPPQKPADARAWGYFHMLSHDSHWWIDNHQFGIGPDPKNYWRTLYSSAPPDVIAIGSLGDFLFRRYRLAVGQRVDISWLWTEMKKHYVCVTDGMLRIHVRAEIANRFASKPWRSCKPDAYLFLERPKDGIQNR